MSDTGPQFTLEQDGVFTRVDMEYTNDSLDAMAQRAAERIEDELAQQLLARLGYVKPVRCRDCECAQVFHPLNPITGVPAGIEYWRCAHFWNADELCEVEPDGFCAWGERREDA